MYKKKCRCEATEKNFKFDIGEFFVNECCEKAGYDEKGKLEGDYELEGDEILKEADPKALNKDQLAKLKDTTKESLDLSKMSQKALQELCSEKGIKFAKNESKAKLREKLQ